LDIEPRKAVAWPFEAEPVLDTLPWL
jgi:hypothetical protein